MCEFCSLGPNDRLLGGRDRFDPNFSGFFSAAAIEDAVRQANATVNNRNDNDDDDDGSGGGEEDEDGT